MKANPLVVAIILFVLSIAAYVGVISPMSMNLLKAKARQGETKVRMTSVQVAISQKTDFKDRIAALEAENEKICGLWFSPMLNSYAMRAKSLVDSFAAQAGLTQVEYEEGDYRALPVPKERLPERRTGRRSVRIRALADYAAAVSFLMRVEKELPLVTLQALSIKPPQQGTPERQEVEMILEWPSQGEEIK